MGKINITDGYNYNSATDEMIDYEEITEIGNANPTSRVLEGSSDHGYEQEWVAPCRLSDGRTGMAVYLFTLLDLLDDEGESCDTADYPWDEDHLHRVKLDINQD